MCVDSLIHDLFGRVNRFVSNRVVSTRFVSNRVVPNRFVPSRFVSKSLRVAGP